MWLQRVARTEVQRLERNLLRLEDLRQRVHHLGLMVLATQSGSYQVLKELLSEKLVLGNQLIRDKLNEALLGENNQKIALDSPMKFQGIMNEAEVLVKREILKAQRQLRELE